MEATLTCQPLQLENLSLRAGGRSQGRLLFRDVSITMQAGERWVVLGPNGAGKSTLLVALAGLLDPDQGNILLGNRALGNWNPQSLARERAWCPQFWLDPFPVSAWETVASGLLATHSEFDGDQAREQACEWLRQFDAGELSDMDVRSLSGGERQRVALATAFAQGSPLLLLDEPTAHLDWAHQSLLLTRLKDWSALNGITITVLHDLNLAWSLGTHILLLDGKGGAKWGERKKILQADLLAEAFGIPVSVQETDGQRWFRIELEKAP